VRKAYPLVRKAYPRVRKAYPLVRKAYPPVRETYPPVRKAYPRVEKVEFPAPCPWKIAIHQKLSSDPSFSLSVHLANVSIPRKPVCAARHRIVLYVQTLLRELDKKSYRLL
jgi:hypothetical protein